MENVPGFYGKFPELGDFVNRRLPQEFIECWDEWLQSAVATSREQLGDAWLDMYLTSPIWKFVLSKGLCGEYPWIGLMMPSVDRVGRYFPLTVACRLFVDANLVDIITRGSGWFEMADQIILSALVEHDFNMEEFDAKVTALGAIERFSETAGSRTDIGFGSAWQIPMPSSSLCAVLPAVTHQLLHQRFGEYSLWWGKGSEKVTPSLLVCTGMPQAMDFSAMLSGDWNSGSWEQWPTGDALSDERGRE